MQPLGRTRIVLRGRNQPALILGVKHMAKEAKGGASKGGTHPGGSKGTDKGQKTSSDGKKT